MGDPRGTAVVFPSAEAIGSAAAAQASAENFPVALRLLPGRYRRRLEAVYGYARAVDDMGDEAPPGDWHAILGVRPDASFEEITRAYQAGLAGCDGGDEKAVRSRREAIEWAFSKARHLHGRS